MRLQKPKTDSVGEVGMREQTIFIEALEIADPAERAAFLDRACGPDQALRQRVDKLLQRHQQDDSFLASPAIAPAMTGDYTPDPGGQSAITGPIEEPGTVIGPYKLLQQIGEGGMGTVYMAEQTRPVQRLVALKIIKPGMDSRQVIARFEAERQALALMDHPSIARVLDGGTTETGRPYFVMELVKGVPITKFCDERRLTPRVRLELFIQVCQAIQHAHQKGIIHRDLKPSNVLIALYDDKPVPKVIDFGIAKATGQKLTERTMFTEFGQVVGTLEYMSPEQAGLNQLDIDTRSDVYSLGVLLYELLTGSTPLERKRLKEAAVLEVLRLIREEEPPRPSTRLSTTDEIPTVAANRGQEPKKLSGLVRGDLDWVVMKALEKDRNRRYETANGFAMDVQRYLADEPVLACPPSAWYRVRKFARRNRAGLATAGLILFFLVFLGGGVGWIAWDRAAKQRDTEQGATAALAQAEVFLSEGDKEIDNPARWQATVRLADSAVQRAEELLALGRATADLTERVRRVREAVSAAQTDSGLAAELERIALEKAQSRQNFFRDHVAPPRYAAVLRGYGIDPGAPEEAAARVHHSRLREVLLAALEDWSRVTPDATEQKQLAAVLEAAEPAPDAFRARWRAAVRRGNGPALAQFSVEPGVPGLPAAALVVLAKDLRNAKEYAAAERVLRAGQQRYRSNFWLNHDLGRLLDDSHRSEEAVPYLTAAVALRSDSAGVYLNLGNALLGKKDLDGAIREYRAALEIDPNYAMAHSNLGNALRDHKDLDGAIREYQAALKIDPNFALAHNGLGNALLDNNDLEGAIREYRAALKIDPNFAQAHSNLGIALRDHKDLDGAIREYQAALKIEPNDALAHYDLGNALFDHKDLDGAIREYRAALKIDPNFARAHNNLGIALRDNKDLDGAICEYQAALKIDPNSARAHNNLGIALQAKGELGAAIVAFRKAIDCDQSDVSAHTNLGTALATKGELEKAIAEFHKAIALNSRFVVAHRHLGKALAEKRDWEGAIKHLRVAVELNPMDATVHVDLGNVLQAKGVLQAKDELDAAIREYEAALKIDPNYAEARCNLGCAFLHQGRFTEAAASLRRGHQLGSSRQDWRHPTAWWLARAERFVELDAKLPKILDRQARPRDAAEQAELAYLCGRYKGLNAAAERFYADAFAAEPNLAEDPRRGDRYNAACFAALAGCGQGSDASNLPDKVRLMLRRQALDWLRADLEAWHTLLRQDSDKVRPTVREQMRAWLQDADLAGVRGNALSTFPQAERQHWQKLWADAQELLVKSGGNGFPQEK
jgi:tetratricopeptide (TPR) repeat protein/serine/threonine protein kinase